MSPRTQIASRSFILILATIPASGIILFILRDRMTPGIAFLTLWHVIGGVALVIPAVFVWRHRESRSARGPVRRLAEMLAAVTVLAGYAMLALALAGSSARRIPFAYELHVLAAFMLCMAPIASVIASRTTFKTSSGVAVGIALASTAALGALSYQPDRIFRALTAVTPRQARNPLFPAGSVVPMPEQWRAAQNPPQCGQSGCHPDAHASWMNSRHADSASNPQYRVALSRAIKDKGSDFSRWCAGCHDPASLRPGTSRSSGVDCLSCHSMHEVPIRIGGGHAIYAAPEPYPFAWESEGIGRTLHDFLVRVRPRPHRDSLSSRSTKALREQTCLPCHRLGVTAAQNDYGFLHYDSSWDQWHASHYSGRSLRSFLPPAARTPCASCHPAHGPSPPEAETVRRLRESLSIQVFAFRLRGASPAAERVEARLAGRRVIVRPGERVAVDVLVRSEGIGHAFPAGVPDIRSAWIEVRVADLQGRALAGPDVRHRFGLTVLGRDSRRIPPGAKDQAVANIYSQLEGHAQTGRTTYRAIQSGEAEVARYTLTVPETIAGLRITAALVYRRSPSVSAVRIGEQTVTAYVTGADAAPPGAESVADTFARARERWEDHFAYGIALFNQKDPQRARAAFQQARALNPDSASVWIAIARAYLEEGDLLSAQSSLQTALRIEPGSPRANAWLGRTLRVMGRYHEALAVLDSLAESYPEDPLTHFDIGLSLFRLGRLKPAVAAFHKVLAIVPDDSGAHLNLMLCYRRLMRLSDARREEAIYRNLRGEGGPGSIIDRFLAANPEEAVERTLRHEHPIEIKP